jgi:2-amino-4-hydroxy-6-hydroxymethyldihydropteridine diphosphokinase
MNKAAIALGANMGDRLASLRRAVKALSGKAGTVISTSEVYETTPWGMTDQPSFLNAAIIIETELCPMELLAEVKKIEQELGRVESVRWGPREIDLDIIFYGDAVVDDPMLKIPHPHMRERSFVLAPLADIAPDWANPSDGRTVKELLAGVGLGGVTRITHL